jgi:hypothetical protein
MSHDIAPMLHDITPVLHDTAAMLRYIGAMYAPFFFLKPACFIRRLGGGFWDCCIHFLFK